MTWREVRDFCYALSNDKQINSSVIKQGQVGDQSIRFISSNRFDILDFFEMSYIMYTVVFRDMYDDTCDVYVKSYDVDLSMKLYTFDIDDSVEGNLKDLFSRFMKLMNKNRV